MQLAPYWPVWSPMSWVFPGPSERSPPDIRVGRHRARAYVRDVAHTRPSHGNQRVTEADTKRSASDGYASLNTIFRCYVCHELAKGIEIVAADDSDNRGCRHLVRCCVSQRARSYGQRSLADQLRMVARW